MQFLFKGFGEDNDAWLMAVSSLDLLNTGTYHVSRFPGYPLPELVSSLTIGLGWMVTVLLTFAISMIGVYFFAKILKEEGVKNRGAIIPAFALMPLVLLSGSTFMDYSWSLTFLIISWYSILKQRYVPAGIFFALAVGSRLTAILFILPLGYLLWTRSMSLRKLSTFALVTVVVLGIVTLPLTLTYGSGFLRFYSTDTDWSFTVDRFLHVFGPPALLVGGAIVAITFLRGTRSLISRDEETIFLSLAVLIPVAMFLYAPYEIFYLLPAIPFALLLLNKFSPTVLFVAFCILLVSNSFISFGDYNASKPALEVQQNILDEFSHYRGIVMEDAEEVVDSLPNHSVVMEAGIHPAVYYIEKTSSDAGSITPHVFDGSPVWNTAKDIGYFYMMTLSTVQEYQQRGYAIYCTPDARDAIVQTYGYDPLDLGAIIV